MTGIPASIIIVIALLALFLIGITIVKYAVANAFMRTRLQMSALFFFIMLTLTISFWPYAALTLPFTIPMFFVGVLLGYAVGVHTERQKLMANGLEHYLEHFARIDPEDVKKLSWWTIVNFYSVMCGLVLINLVGFTNVILHGSPLFVIVTSSVGAALIGSILPYLAHLWSIPLSGQKDKRTAR
jgi:hypothetical protein